ncbi:olfactory receptor 14A16-like [Orycteropus afer afer]|uniref:Olfactory receptor 14A16-like n=1 Tax=Orycteropus afer afer TaxID=1230840 RepID=A0AC54ZGC2_ORYAF|nr:olfactory receptor 14A16-like [Orycteropus afer afer]
MNISVVTEFHLVGFAGPWKLQVFQAGIFILIYLAALMGNGLIISITSWDPCLCTPMYFFLRNLSLFDLCLISAVVPKTIVNSFTNSNYISFLGCAAQVFLVAFSAATELFLLTAMSIDRFIAICHPLHYALLMKRDTCVQMTSLACLSGGLMSLIHTASTFSLSYCGLNEIKQFFCDIPQLLAISCSEDITAEVVLIIINAIVFQNVSLADIKETTDTIPEKLTEGNLMEMSASKSVPEDEEGDLEEAVQEDKLTS